MISASIIDQGTIDTTLPATSDPMYQVASLALFYKQQFAALRTAGFQFARPETSDFTAYNTAADDWLDDANARFDAWLQGAVGEVIGNVPDVLSIGAAFVSGGATEVGAILLSKILNHMFHVEDSRAQYEGARENVDTEAIVDKLEEVREQIEATLNEFNINLYRDAEDSSVKYGQLDT